MPSSLSIAVVEDHRALNEVFVDYLESLGSQVFGCFSAEDLDELFARRRVDLLILDVNLPGEDGISIAKRYREAYPFISIIMLTVKASVKDKILGYESGADMYLPKPVSAEELGAAVLSIKRRVIDSKQDTDLPRLAISTRSLVNQHLKVSLSQQEQSLLKGLIEAPNNLLEYWQLLELLDKEITDKNKASLAVYVHRLNKKLEDIGLTNPAIQVAWKTGYQLTSKIIII